MNLYRGTASVVSTTPVPKEERPKERIGFRLPRVAVKTVEVRRDPERERALRGA